MLNFTDIICDFKYCFYLEEATVPPEISSTLSFQEALETLKEHELKNTVRFSVHSLTKDFGDIGNFLYISHIFFFYYLVMETLSMMLLSL